jgi:hypothetical protein
MTEQQRRNLENAKNLAANRVGWAGASNDIPYELNERYVTELAKIILAYPARFDEQTLANARKELGDTPNAPLHTYTLGDAAGDFASGAADGVGSVVESVADVGEGVKSTLKLSRWLIPVAAIIAAAIALKAFARRSGASA